MRKAIAVVLGTISLAVLGFGMFVVYGLADEYGVGIELVPVVVIVLVLSALFALPARGLYTSAAAHPVGMQVDREDPGSAV